MPHRKTIRPSCGDTGVAHLQHNTAAVRINDSELKVRLPTLLLDALKQMADDQDDTISEFTRRLIAAELTRRGLPSDLTLQLG